MKHLAQNPMNLWFFGIARAACEAELSSIFWFLTSTSFSFWLPRVFHLNRAQSFFTRQPLDANYISTLTNFLQIKFSEISKKMLAKGLKSISLMTKMTRTFAAQTSVPEFQDIHKLNDYIDSVAPSVYCSAWFWIFEFWGGFWRTRAMKGGWDELYCFIWWATKKIPSWPPKVCFLNFLLTAEAHMGRFPISESQKFSDRTQVYLQPITTAPYATRQSQTWKPLGPISGMTSISSEQMLMMTGESVIISSWNVNRNLWSVCMEEIMIDIEGAIWTIWWINLDSKFGFCQRKMVPAGLW